MSNRTDFDTLAFELQEQFRLSPAATKRIATELQNAFIAGQEEVVRQRPALDGRRLDRLTDEYVLAHFRHLDGQHEASSALRILLGGVAGLSQASAADTLVLAPRIADHPADAPPFPTAHPFTGAPFTTIGLDVENGSETHHYQQPSPPTRTIPVFDDDGDMVDERHLTDEEFAAAQATYQKAKAEWTRTGWMFVTTGQRLYSILATCADGSSAEYDTVPGASEWRMQRAQSNR